MLIEFEKLKSQGVKLSSISGKRVKGQNTQVQNHDLKKSNFENNMQCSCRNIHFKFKELHKRVLLQNLYTFESYFSNINNDTNCYS